MNTYEKLQSEINAIKEINQEAGNILHEQLHRAVNAEWGAEDLSEMIKTDRDVADLFFSNNQSVHDDVRNIQDGIIGFFGN